MRLAFLPVQLLDGFASTSSSVAGVLPGLFQNAGFQTFRIDESWSTLFGTLHFYHAQRQAE